MRKRQRSPSSPEQKVPLDLPLECQDPKDFGDFDKEQRFLLERGALDLVLVENAAELMRRVMMEHGNIEKILNLLSKRYEGCGVLPSETFPIYTDDPNEKWQNTGTLKEYKSAVLAMRKQYIALSKKKGINCISAVFGLMVEEDGSGHYGSFYIENNQKGRVYIFDSMQNSSSGSSYTPFFAQLARDIFETEDIVIDSRFNSATSLQLTGGFSGNKPLMLRTGARYPDGTTTLDIEAVRLQCTESQNHFCYMWSIWSIHLRMLGKEPFVVAREIFQRQVDPLTVIKRYIWALFNFEELRFIDQIPYKYRAFFAYHWPVIWTNDPLRKLKFNTVFVRYVIPLDTCQDISDCAFLSYEQLKVLTTQEITFATPESQKLIDCRKKKK